MNDWVQCLSENLQPVKLLQPKGKGWKTMKQICEESEWGINKTRSAVMGGVKDKKIEVFSGTMLNASGIKSRQHWYRVK